MKNLNKLSLVSLIGFLFFTSCTRDTISTDTGNVATAPENEFVWKGLNSWYYWQKTTPVLADGYNKTAKFAELVSGKSADALFYSLVTDPFSWIEKDGAIKFPSAALNAAKKGSGINYTLFKVTGTNYYIGMVNYVTKGSPAADAGIVRGNVITEIRGERITTSNYRDLDSDMVTITYQSMSRDAENKIVFGDKKAAVIVTRNVNDDPVAFYKLFKNSGKNIGYLVYNAYDANFDSRLDAAFLQMKQDNVTDLILDLRYNGGGSVNTAIGLSYLIAGRENSPFVSLKFNEKHPDQNVTYKLGNTLGGGANESLNLSKVYVLTSQGTASASELTIDGLGAYIDVIRIGGTTYGKFVGSITLYDSPDNDYISKDNIKAPHNHGWTMQPIVFGYWNAKNNPHPQKTDDNPNGGLMPTFPINSNDYFGTLKEFGDENSDIALIKALQEITKQTTSVAALKLMASSKSFGSQSERNDPGQFQFFGTKNTLTPNGTKAHLDKF